MKHQDLIKKWEKDISTLLVGRKIVAVRYMSETEMNDHGWNDKALVIQLDNGLMIYPSADDEGNGAGALFTTDDKMPILPVIQ